MPPSTLEYKHYTAKIWHGTDGMFHGQVLGLRDVVTFQAPTIEDLDKEFANSIEKYLEFCAERKVAERRKEFLVEPSTYTYRSGESLMLQEKFNELVKAHNALVKKVIR